MEDEIYIKNFYYLTIIKKLITSLGEVSFK